MPQIDELLPKVMADIGAIPKLQRNRQQGYEFRGIDDALRHCNPILVKHGVSVSVECRQYDVQTWVQERNGKDPQRQFHATLLMAISFHAPDGSERTNVLAGEGLDFGSDKATNKAMAAAMKYGIFFGLVVPVERQAVEDSDRSYEHTENAKQSHASGKPGDEVSPFVLARGTILNSLAVEMLDRVAQRIGQRFDEGSFSEDEKATLDALIARQRETIGQTVKS